MSGKAPIALGLVSGQRDKWLSQGKVRVGRDSFPTGLCPGRAWHLLPPHLPELQMAAYTSFRPPHLLPAPTPASGQGRGASGREASVLPRRTPWCTPHPLDLLTPRVLGPGTIDPEPQRVLLGTWYIGGCSQETGQESELESGLQQISGEDLWSTRGGVPLGKGAILSSLCQSEPGWDLGPGTRWCRACNWTDIASSNKILRNPKGLKVTASVLQLGQIMKNKIQKDKTTTVSCEEPGAKAEYWARPLYSITSKGWAGT